MTSAFPVDLIVRRAAERIVSGWLDHNDPHEPWEIAQLLGEIADEVNRPDLAFDFADPHVAAVEETVTALIGEVRHYLEFGPNPTPDAYAALCAALEKHRRRADDAEVEVERLRGKLERAQIDADVRASRAAREAGSW